MRRLLAAPLLLALLAAPALAAPEIPGWSSTPAAPEAAPGPVTDSLVLRCTAADCAAAALACTRFRLQEQGGTRPDLQMLLDRVQSPSGQLGYWLAQRTLQERPDIAPPVVAEAAPLSTFTQRRIGGRQVATARASLGKPVAVEMVLAFWLQDRRLQGLRCAHRPDGSGAVATRIEALLAAPPAAAP